MVEFNCSLPADGSVSSVGAGTDVSTEAGGLASAGASICPICRSTVTAFAHLWP
jgi:hypothetical protein